MERGAEEIVGDRLYGALFIQRLLTQAAQQIVIDVERGAAHASGC